MAQFEFYLTHSLEKVFPGKRAAMLEKNRPLCGLKNEVVSFQLVYTCHDGENGMPLTEFSVSAEGASVRMRKVDLMPSDYPCYSHYDTNYITNQPGMFPDLLSEFDGKILPIHGQMRSIWMDIDCSRLSPGIYDLTIKATAARVTRLASGMTMECHQAEELDWQEQISLKVLDVALPKQTLLHTEWFHADCLADYYHVPSFGEEHWSIVENFIRFAGQECGVNMLLTPVFTQPLDTTVGGERTTVQLVDIVKTGSHYTFGFEKLGRWCELCQKYGVENLEIVHFFTQWGAYATPKIIVEEDGISKQLFGWDIPSTDQSYRVFLEAFVPQLLAFLRSRGYTEKTLYFHISDEPGEAQLESYLAAKKQVADLLEGYTIIDALSSYEFYKQGIVEHPIPSNDHIQPFIDHQVPDLWVYYCCIQGVNVPNRFYSMPSTRNRIMGVLMYLYDIKGFLHWGYNFYNSKYSVSHIDPYKNTHADYGFPSGDAYLVYPGADKKPLSSIRNQVQMEALYDLRAFCLLEQMAGRDRVEQIIMEGVKETITFQNYPQSAEWLLALRHRVNREIEIRNI